MSSALADVELIYSDNPGSLAAQYPLVEDINLQSVVARIDGSAAASTFLPTLSLYSQDGKLIVRVPSDLTYAVGDTGVVTWSPFLVRRITTALQLNVVGAAVSRPNTSPQSCPSSTGWGVTISWTTVNFDTGSFFAGGSPTRLTAPQAGLYIVNLSGSFVANSTGDRQAHILFNGTTELGQVQGRAPGTFFWTGFVSVIVQMVAGDYVEAQMGQNSGANRDTANCFMSILGFGQT